MNNYKLAILFVLQKIKINKKGQCPIKCRITFKKTRKEFSIGIFINPNYWESGKQKTSYSFSYLFWIQLLANSFHLTKNYQLAFVF